MNFKHFIVIIECKNTLNKLFFSFFLELSDLTKIKLFCLKFKKNLRQKFNSSYIIL